MFGRKENDPYGRAFKLPSPLTTLRPFPDIFSRIPTSSPLGSPLWPSSPCSSPRLGRRDGYMSDISSVLTPIPSWKLTSSPRGSRKDLVLDSSTLVPRNLPMDHSYRSSSPYRTGAMPSSNLARRPVTRIPRPAYRDLSIYNVTRPRPQFRPIERQESMGIRRGRQVIRIKSRPPQSLPQNALSAGAKIEKKARNVQDRWKIDWDQPSLKDKEKPKVVDSVVSDENAKDEASLTEKGKNDVVATWIENPEDVEEDEDELVTQVCLPRPLFRKYSTVKKLHRNGSITVHCFLRLRPKISHDVEHTFNLQLPTVNQVSPGDDDQINQASFTIGLSMASVISEDEEEDKEKDAEKVELENDLIPIISRDVLKTFDVISVDNMEKMEKVLIEKSKSRSRMGSIQEEFLPNMELGEGVTKLCVNTGETNVEREMNSTLNLNEEGGEKRSRFSPRLEERDELDTLIDVGEKGKNVLVEDEEIKKEIKEVDKLEGENEACGVDWMEDEKIVVQPILKMKKVLDLRCESFSFKEEDERRKVLKRDMADEMKGEERKIVSEKMRKEDGSKFRERGLSGGKLEQKIDQEKLEDGKDVLEMKMSDEIMVDLKGSEEVETLGEKRIRERKFSDEKRVRERKVSDEKRVRERKISDEKRVRERKVSDEKRVRDRKVSEESKAAESKVSDVNRVEEKSSVDSIISGLKMPEEIRRSDFMILEEINNLDFMKLEVGKGLDEKLLEEKKLEEIKISSLKEEDKFLDQNKLEEQKKLDKRTVTDQTKAEDGKISDIKKHEEKLLEERKTSDVKKHEEKLLEERKIPDVKKTEEKKLEKRKISDIKTHEEKKPEEKKLSDIKRSEDKKLEESKILEEKEPGQKTLQERKISDNKKAEEKKSEEREISEIKKPEEKTLEERKVSDIKKPEEKTLDERKISDIKKPEEKTLDERKISDIKKPEEIKISDIKKPEEIKISDIKKPEEIKISDIKKPEEIKISDIKKPEEIKISDIKKPEEIKISDIKKPEEIKISDIKKPEEIKISDIKKPEEIKISDIKKPEEIKISDIKKPEEIKISDIKKPEEKKSEERKISDIKKPEEKTLDERKISDIKKPEEIKMSDIKKPEEIKTADIKKPEENKSEERKISDIQKLEEKTLDERKISDIKKPEEIKMSDIKKPEEIKIADIKKPEEKKSEERKISDIKKPKQKKSEERKISDIKKPEEKKSEEIKMSDIKKPEEKKSEERKISDIKKPDVKKVSNLIILEEDKILDQHKIEDSSSDEIKLKEKIEEIEISESNSDRKMSAAKKSNKSKPEEDNLPNLKKLDEDEMLNENKISDENKSEDKKISEEKSSEERKTISEKKKLSDSMPSLEINDKKVEDFIFIPALTRLENRKISDLKKREALKVLACKKSEEQNQNNYSNLENNNAVTELSDHKALINQQNQEENQIETDEDSKIIGNDQTVNPEKETENKAINDIKSAPSLIKQDNCPVCGVNCQHKCEQEMPTECGVNEKLLAEALSSVKREPTVGYNSNTVSVLNEAEAFLEGSQRSFSQPTQKETRLRFRKYNFKEFNYLKILGKGSFGKVMLANLKGSNRLFAVKCLKKDVVLEDDDVDCAVVERKVLALGSKHPFLCSLFCTFQTESRLFFVMEYLSGGDLMHHIQLSGRFDQDRSRFYAAEIASALVFLHKKCIIYRDLKLDNILLDDEGHVRIADFGMCKLQVYRNVKLDTFCGTPDYMAPEIIKGHHYNQSVDWWAFGVLMYEMLVGQSPFNGCDEDDLFWCICNEEAYFPRFLSKESTDLMSLLFVKEPEHRLGTPGSEVMNIKEHPYFYPINWEKLERKEVKPPFIPHLETITDVSNFDNDFTAEQPLLTPIDPDILAEMDQTQFIGFSYTNPNATD